MDDAIKTLLEKIAPEVPGLCAGTAWTLFGVKFKVPEKWVIVPRLECDSYLACTLGASSEYYQGTFVIGAECADAEKIFNGDKDVEFQLDGFGEYLNTMCSKMCSLAAFAAGFGILRQAPPFFVGNGGLLLFTTAWGIRGRLATAEGVVLNVGFSIKER